MWFKVSINITAYYCCLITYNLCKLPTFVILNNFQIMTEYFSSSQNFTSCNYSIKSLYEFHFYPLFSCISLEHAKYWNSNCNCKWLNTCANKMGTEANELISIYSEVSTQDSLTRKFFILGVVVDVEAATRLLIFGIISMNSLSWL